MPLQRWVFAAWVGAWGVESAFAYTAYLTLAPPSPTSRTPVTVNVELTNDSLDPCDVEVRVAMAYAGLMFFEEEREGSTFTYRGGLWPHFVVPIVPCEVPCIEVVRPPHAVYATFHLGRLEPGDYEVLVYLPGLCDLPTDCPAVPVVPCEYELPLRARFHVEGPAPVRRRALLTTAWARLKAPR